MKNQKSTLKPLTELSIASLFWGFGFIATVWVLKFIDSPAIIFYRFLGAFAVGAIFLPFAKLNKSEIIKEFKLASTAGFWLSLTLVLQAWGLKTTTATKSAFITTLYVVFVPFGSLLLKEKLPKRHWLWVTIALIGTGFILDLKFENLGAGDSLTFINAITAAIHILVLAKLSPRSKDHFTFNTFQSFWTALFCLPLLALNTRWSLFTLDTQAWWGLFSVTIGSSLIAFWLQIRAQEKISASLASVLFLLESPVSMFFAYWLLNERLSVLQLLGCLLIFISCLGASLGPSKKY